MNQRKKNIRQLIYLVILLVTTTLVVIIGNDHTGIDYNKKMFTLDENAVITTVILDGKDFTNRFEYLNRVWLVNDTFLIDEGMRDVFFALLSRVEVQRPVSTLEKDSIAQYLRSEGVQVTVLNNGDTIKTYLTGGNENKFQSYFMDIDEQQPYLVHIPGYQSFIAGIFKASQNDWRTRYIWDIDWSSLKKLRVISPRDNNDSLVFEYDNNFIGMKGINKIDTANMMGYLENLAYLQTNKYLEKGEIEVYDQVTTTEAPLAVIEVEQIGNRFASLKLFPQPEGKQYIPGILNEKQLLLFKPDILESILLKQSDFERRE